MWYEVMIWNMDWVKMGGWDTAYIWVAFIERRSRRWRCVSVVMVGAFVGTIYIHDLMQHLKSGQGIIELKRAAR